MQIDHTCANPACDCKVPNAGDFCDESCRRQAMSNAGEGCLCSHPDCSHRKTVSEGT